MKYSIYKNISMNKVCGSTYLEETLEMTKFYGNG